MAGNILESITAQYHSLTRSGKKLADYIFAHTGEAQYFSMSTLAENSGVSEASITRFCHGLGLAGYNDFKLALAKTDHVTDMGELSDSPQGIASEDSLNTIFQKIHKASVLSLNETLELLDEDAINKAVDLLEGISLAEALEMTKDMEDTLQIAREHGVSIILVTHYPNSRAAQFADVVLLCGYNEGPLQSGSIPAKVGQLLLIDCLFYGFCRRNPEASAAARSATAEAVARKML